MTERKIIRHRGKLPPDKVARVRESMRWAQEHRDELDQIAEAGLAELETLEAAIRSLKAAREAKGLSLTDVAARSGIDKANLSRLENDPHPNPTWSTLNRIAHAIGVRLDIVVRDAA